MEKIVPNRFQLCSQPGICRQPDVVGAGVVDDFSHCVAGHDGEAAYFYSQHYSSPASIDYPGSLAMAVASATGISSGTAHTIGALLFAEVGGFTLLRLKRIRFRRNRMVLGVPCVCVSGLHPKSGHRVTAWFGAEDMLLRRMYRSRNNSEELRFSPAIQCSFEPDAFLAPSVKAA